MSGLHHVELWVAEPPTLQDDWAWLLQRLGFMLETEWPGGQTWAAGGSYLTLTTSPNLSDPTHDRRRAGLNHLAFRADSREAVDAVMAEAPERGWTPLYQERYPHAGGDGHYAGWLENAAGFKAEVVSEES